MQLESIHLVQFYLYERETVRLGGITGIFGPNGSGKSSFIDAVQIAMFGGNQNLVALNAQADDKTKSTRNIRGYCLGQYDAQAHQRVRDRATTYITLVWRDTVSGRPVSMGVCLSASGEQDGHDVLGRFVADGVELSLGDHLFDEGGLERPRDWKAFRAGLAKRIEQVSGHPEEAFFDNADKYMKAFLTLMSNGKDAGSISLFKRAFRFGLRMRFDKPVDAIVRDEVLEARPVNVRAFREITETFRNLRQLIESVQKKIAAGEEIDRHFTEADRLEKRAASWSVLEADVQAEKAQSEANRAIEAAQAAREKWDDAIEKRQSIEARVQTLETEQERIRAQRDSHQAHGQLSHLEMLIAREQKQLASEEGAFKGRLSELRLALINASGAESLKAHAEALTASAETVSALVTQAQDADQGMIARVVRQAIGATRDAMETLYRDRRNLETSRETLLAEKATLESNLERVKTGKAPLPSGVAELMRHLGDNGIESVPVCDLVRVSDAAWQPVIEAFLGETNLVALLVDAEQEKEAFKVYRALDARSAIYGVKLLMPSRLQLRAAPKGSVAELVVGEDDRAVAFLRGILGDIRCANSNEEAMSGGRAMTQDGMYVGRDTFERRHPVRADRLRLGVRIEAHAERISIELNQLKPQIKALDQKIDALRTLMDLLGRIPQADAFIAELDRDRATMRQRAADLAAAQSSLNAIGGEDYQVLCRQIKEIEHTLRLERQAQIDATRVEGQCEAECLSREAQAQRLEESASNAQNQARTRREETVFDVDYAQGHWDQLLETHGENWAAMIRYCDGQRNNRILEMNTAINKGQRALMEFVQAYRETPDQAALDDWHQAHPWIQEIVARLQRTELVDYEEQMRRAEKASQDTFRTDVALTLHNNLEWLDQQMRRLNGVLNRCPPFSNGERYVFKRTLRTQYEPLLRFIQSVSEHGPEEDLFGGPGEIPVQFMALLDEVTATGAAGARSPIEDYREFFEFDIDIKREGEDGVSRVVSQLSKRIGHGSGGEHRAPLYVIAGAALASAYNIDGDHGAQKEGMRLILLDEAFNKMDAGNIIATMRYLEDLGLQIFLASPGENLGTLTAFMNRYYNILRDAEHNVVMIEAHDVSEAARALMRSDLPEFHPELIERALNAQKMTAPAVQSAISPTIQNTVALHADQAPFDLIEDGA